MSVLSLAVRMGGGRTQVSFIYPPQPAILTALGSECSGKSIRLWEGWGRMGVARKALGLGVWSWGAYRESVVMHSLDHISKEDLGSKGMAMVDDGLPSRPLPAVKFHTAASLGKGPIVDRQTARQTVGVPQNPE